METILYNSYYNSIFIIYVCLRVPGYTCDYNAYACVYTCVYRVYTCNYNACACAYTVCTRVIIMCAPACTRVSVIFTRVFVRFTRVIYAKSVSDICHKSTFIDFVCNHTRNPYFWCFCRFKVQIPCVKTLFFRNRLFSSISEVNKFAILIWQIFQDLQTIIRVFLS